MKTHFPLMRPVFSLLAFVAFYSGAFSQLSVGARYDLTRYDLRGVISRNSSGDLTCRRFNFLGAVADYRFRKFLFSVALGADPQEKKIQVEDHIR